MIIIFAIILAIALCCFIKKKIYVIKVLKYCKCEDDLTLQELHGKSYGGKFKCLNCGKITEARIINK